MRSIKRHLASERCTLLSNEVVLCLPHLQSNPYRTESVKHERWQQLCDYIIQKKQLVHTQSVSVFDILQNTTFTATQLWNEARLKHLDINIRPLQATTHTSVLTYFDNIRTQWTELSVVCGVSGEVVSCFNATDVPELTIQDICVSIENACGGVWTPPTKDAMEWSFVLQDSVEQTVISTRTQMQSQWWSIERLSYHTHNYAQIHTIKVFPMEYDAEIQQEFDLSSNRQLYATQLQKDERQQLRQEQDAAYYQSLEADVAKPTRTTRFSDSCSSETTTEIQTPEQQNENDTYIQTPLSAQQLREARCRFFLNSYDR